METSRFNNGTREQGFTVLEVLISIAVLTIGLCSLALLTAQTVTGTERARYMSLATTLASEKLEDLNRWPSVDPHVAAGGSLTSDSANGTLDYYDDIDLSNTTGQVSETVASTSSGTTTYTSVVHKATGEIDSPSTAAPASGSGLIAFHRRWLVEANPIVNGVTLTGGRRVTVLVSLSNVSVSPPVSFQVSLVRP